MTIETARQLRDDATDQYRAAYDAYAKWDKWNRKLVTQEEDGGGEYSGAAAFEWLHRGAAGALCQSASRIQSLLGQMPVSDKDVQLEIRSVDSMTCPQMPAGNRDYEHFLQNWLATKQRVYDIENSILDVCYKKIPNWQKPKPSLRPFLP